MSLDRIYHYYFHDVYRFLLSLCHDHYTAEDLLQETFFRAYLHLENYKDEHVKTWLFTVARNAFIDYYRQQQRSIIKDKQFFKQYADHSKQPLDHMIMDENMQEVIKLLQNLPEKHKQAVLLRDFHDFSYKEGAKVMDVSLAYFKVLLFRGRQEIRNRKAGDEWAMILKEN